jgi:hypothetical protein
MYDTIAAPFFLKTAQRRDVVPCQLRTPNAQAELLVMFAVWVAVLVWVEFSA